MSDRFHSPGQTTRTFLTLTGNFRGKKVRVTGSTDGGLNVTAIKGEIDESQTTPRNMSSVSYGKAGLLGGGTRNADSSIFSKKKKEETAAEQDYSRPPRPRSTSHVSAI